MQINNNTIDYTIFIPKYDRINNIYLNPNKLIENSEIDNTIDSIIMDYYDKGLIYFTELIYNYNTLSHNKEIFSKYIENYTYIFLEKTITNTNINYFINNRPEVIINFTNTLLTANFSSYISNLWFLKVYTALTFVFRKTFKPKTATLILSFFINHLGFLNIFKKYELNEKYKLNDIETQTILGNIIKFTNNDIKIKVINEIFYNLIFSDHSFIINWFNFVLSKYNIDRFSTIFTKNNSIIFVLNILRWIFYIYNNSDYFDNTINLNLNNINDITTNEFYTILFKATDYAVAIIFTKYIDAINKLEKLELYSSESYLKVIYKGAISYYENLINENKDILLNNTFIFYNVLLKNTIKQSVIDNNIYSKKTTENFDILLLYFDNITNFYNKSLFSNYNLKYFYNISFQLLSSIETSLFFKSKSFNCILCINLIESNFIKEHNSSKCDGYLNLYKSIIDLYLLLDNDNTMDDFYKYEIQNKIILFFDYNYENLDILQQLTNTLTTTFLYKIISNITNKLDKFIIYYKQILNNTFSDEKMLSLLKKKWYSINIISRLLCDLFKLLDTKIESNNIYISLVECLLFNSIKIIKLPQNIYINKIARNIFKIIDCCKDNNPFTLYLKKTDLNFTDLDIDSLFSLSKLDKTHYNNTIEYFKKTCIKTPVKHNSTLNIPDEFLDPLLCTLIIKPVLLPNTNTIIDMDSIERHLLTKSENPFDRSPLTMEQLLVYNQLTTSKVIINEFTTRYNKWFLDKTQKEDIE